ncbi:hypothetical protein CBR_g22038 [Chara braunii]|uniref:Uncharacterized protein n=1 Tax=Chara braunii TaxID=69332 RepID=A0A388L1V0_CHABU|nr:hypothetical protein CBR_g22038 [Chara braunii]|eukprot:GBG76290.1 hypothetical protein CBR_g22038 [Chara braunii]
MCKIMSMWQKGEVKGQKLKPAARSFLKADQDLETIESERAKKSQRGKRLDRAAAKEQEMALLYPWVQLQGNKVPMVAEDMPENAVPILLEVVAKQISLKEMEKKFQLIKQIAYVCKAFAVGVGAADFKEAEKEYPLHTKKEILEKFVGGIRRGQTSIPALDGHIKRAIEWKNKERRLQAKNAIHTFRTKPFVEPFVEWTEVTHDNDSAEVKIINGDMRLLSKLQTEKLPISLAIFDFPYGFAHEGHASDNEPFPESDVVEVLHNLKDVSNAPLWTVAGFCSVDMLPSIRAIACVKANRNCLVVEINTKCTKGIATRLLTDIGGTLARETLKRKENFAQGSPTSKLSGDTKSAENELVPDENMGTAAGVADSAEAVVVGPSGASLPTVEAVAGPSFVEQTITGAEPAFAVPLLGEGRPVPASMHEPGVVPDARPEAETQPASGPVPAAANAQQSVLSLAMSQESSGTTTGGRKGRKRKAGGEEVSSPHGGVAIGLKANTHSRTAK